MQRQKADRENSKSETENDRMMKTNEKSSFGFMVRMKETKTKHFNEIANITKMVVAGFKDEDRLKEKEYWFELMLDLQNDEFDIGKFRQLSLSDKEEQMRSAQNIIFDQVEIMHYQLSRQYQSLRYLWFAEEICDSSQSILLSARFMIEEFRQAETIRKKSKEEGSNIYAINYYDMQTKILQFKQALFKLALQTEKFWVEFLSEKPDQKKTVKALEEVLKARRELNKEKKRVLQ